MRDQDRQAMIVRYDVLRRQSRQRKVHAYKKYLQASFFRGSLRPIRQSYARETTTHLHLSQQRLQYGVRRLKQYCRRKVREYEENMTRSNAIRGSVAIVGVGVTKQGEIPEKSADEIAAEAIQLALSDSGIDKREIDGLVTCRTLLGRGVDFSIGKLMGLNTKYSATLQYGTANFSLHLAAMAIHAGMASTVVLAYGTNQRSQRLDFSGANSESNLVAENFQSTAPYGLFHEAGYGALAFRRHQALYGTTEEQLGWIPVAQRQWAQMNPLAIFQDRLTIEDYMAQPYLIEPLRRADITMVSDGGVALVMTSADRVRDSRKPPIFLLGMGQVAALREQQNPDNLMRPWLSKVAEDVFGRAGVGPGDIDVAFMQDPISVWVLQMLEHFGFCPVGEGGSFVAEGHTRPGGSLPLNTNGGQLSESYMWGWSSLAEAVRQLRGECVQRQVSGAEVALFSSTDSFIRGAASILSKST